jgi:hypothetical protein
MSCVSEFAAELAVEGVEELVVGVGVGEAEVERKLLGYLEGDPEEGVSVVGMVVGACM